MTILDLMESIISQLSENGLPNIFLYADLKISILKNSQILQSTIKYIFAAKHFDKLLF